MRENGFGFNETGPFSIEQMFCQQGTAGILP
jgi:hypothetical protein